MVYSVFLYPLEGSFDTEPIERYLANKIDVLLDPLGTDTHILCGMPEAKKVIRDQRLADPSRFPYSVLVTVGFHEVNVFQEWGNEAGLRSARDFVDWMLKHYRCCIADEYDKDWTERVAQEGTEVLYPKL